MAAPPGPLWRLRPGRYRGWLRDHLDERAPIPYLREMAAAQGSRLEGQTKADAMLLARDTGVAIIFEAKVLSDISTHVTFDVARNQLARTIDVLLEANSKLRPPLSLRKPERTFLVLLTPALMQTERAGDAISKSRLYGWLMPAYRDPAMRPSLAGAGMAPMRTGTGRCWRRRSGGGSGPG